jgi:hypothetical protein
VWSRVCKDAIRKHDVSLWQEWRISKGRENGWLHLASIQWGPQRYVSKLFGDRLALRASLRLGVSAAGASKLQDNPATCRLCFGSQLETAQHLICECSTFDAERANFWASLGTQQPLSHELACLDEIPRFHYGKRCLHNSSG